MRDRKLFPRSIRRIRLEGVAQIHPLHSVPKEDRKAWRNQLKRERRERRAGA
jgi:hypothetical protein